MIIRLLGSLTFIALIFGIIAYSAGWIQFSHADGTSTIKVKNDKIKKAAKDAAEKGKHALEKTGELLMPSKEPDASNANDSKAKDSPGSNDTGSQ